MGFITIINFAKKVYLIRSLYCRFLQTILRNVSKGLDARIELVNKSEAEQSMLIKEHQEKVEMLTHECRKVYTGIIPFQNTYIYNYYYYYYYYFTTN